MEKILTNKPKFPEHSLRRPHVKRCVEYENSLWILKLVHFPFGIHRGNVGLKLPMYFAYFVGGFLQNRRDTYRFYFRIFQSSASQLIILLERGSKKFSVMFLLGTLQFHPSRGVYEVYFTLLNWGLSPSARVTPQLNGYCVFSHPADEEWKYKSLRVQSSII